MNTGHPSRKVAIAGILGIAICGCGGGALTGGSGGEIGTGGSGSGGTISGVGGSGQDGTGGMNGSGGQPGTGGRSGSGGSIGTGGIAGSGGQPGTGGASGTGGAKGSGGVTASGGTMGTGGQPGVGGTSGTVVRDAGRPDVLTGTGGMGSGGKTGGGGVATGGATSTGTGTSNIDCNAKMPSGGTDHCGQNAQSTVGDLSWSLWCNSFSSSACMTTFGTSAFSARWNNNSDLLARFGLEFGNAGKTYDQYGTMKADLAFKKTGSAGGYSYIGIYGWSTNPCVEWFIVDDRFGTMPFNAYNASLKGTVPIDGADYKLFQNKTNGTGGSRCSGVSQWDQFWSIRQTARQCGTITISEHFKAWEGASLQMGGLLEAKILVETGGGQGSIDFAVAKVTAQ